MPAIESLTFPSDTVRVRLLLSVIALAMLSSMVFLVLLSRVGTAIAVEVDHAQGVYLRSSGGRPGAMNSALQLGQCVRRQMQFSASLGILDAGWAPLARAEAEIQCQQELHPAVPQVAKVGAR